MLMTLGTGVRLRCSGRAHRGRHHQPDDRPRRTRRSAELAARLGRLVRGLRRATSSPMQRVHGASTQAASGRDPTTGSGTWTPSCSKELADRMWSESGGPSAEDHGWRNAQASVLAPDRHHRFADGLRHDRASSRISGLVPSSRSSSVGAPCMIVNQTIPRALRKFGYSEETRSRRSVDYIAEHKPRSSDAPGLRPGALRRCSTAPWVTTVDPARWATST